ncbi:hypothetical protein [Nocardia wallacei]|uniref:WXG100-like domain-containing protein n=1 Tax=Nocardia wallacei TaxID=480035 RepID=UPI0024571B05|nr:hypothetical protein [Nocardia wallacei]
MSIEIPHEVATFLNLLGVPYPDIDEDQVRELARQVRSFAANVAQTHEAATGAVHDMGAVYSGYSYEQLAASWARMSADHMAGLDRACEVVARALEVAAEAIAVVKAAVLAELAALAAGYLSLLAASAATMGVSAALTTAVRAAASRLLTAMEQMLIAYVAAEVIGKAIEPLEDLVGRMVNGVIYEAAEKALGVPPSSSAPLHIEPDEVMRYADLMDEYADDILRHAVRFADNVAALDFGGSDGSEWAAPSRPGGAPGEAVDRGVPSPVDPKGAAGDRDSDRGSAAERTARPGAHEPGGGPESGERPGGAAGNGKPSVDGSGSRRGGAGAGPSAGIPPDGVGHPDGSPATENSATDDQSARDGEVATDDEVAARMPLAEVPNASKSVAAQQVSFALAQQDPLPESAAGAALAAADVVPRSDRPPVAGHDSSPPGAAQSGGHGSAQAAANRSQSSTPWERPKAGGRQTARKPRRRTGGRTGNRAQESRDTPRTPWSEKTHAPPPSPKVFAPESTAAAPPKSPERQADPAPTTAPTRHDPRP